MEQQNPKNPGQQRSEQQPAQQRPGQKQGDPQRQGAGQPHENDPSRKPAPGKNRPGESEHAPGGTAEKQR